MPETTIREALRQTLREELQQDERMVLMGEDIGAYGGSYGVTRGLLQEFGEERVYDTPISESVVVGCGIGAAMGGLRPVIELMTINFSFLAFDQIINNASKLHYMSGGQINVPLVIRMASGGGSQLGAQHSHDLAGWYAHVPGLKVATPSTPYDARGLLKTALREENPVIFVEHTAIYGLHGEVPEEDYAVPFGQAQVIREGGDVTLVGYSGSVHQALRAAEMLASQGMQAEVLNLRTLRPLDVRDDRQLGEEDRPRYRRRGRLVLRRLCRRDCRPYPGTRLRLPRCAGRPRLRRRRADALRARVGTGGAAQRATDRRRGAGDALRGGGRWPTKSLCRRWAPT